MSTQHTIKSMTTDAPALPDIYTDNAGHRIVNPGLYARRRVAASHDALVTALHEAERCMFSMCEANAMPADTCPADVLDMVRAALAAAEGK